MKKRKFSKTETSELTLLSLPAVVWFLLFSYLPIFGVAFAFRQFTPKPGESLFRNLFVNSPFVGLSNFSFLFRSSEMPKILSAR